MLVSKGEITRESEEYKENKKWHEESREIFVDNFKNAITGKPKDSTDGNKIGYKKPKIAKDSVQKTAYTNAPFFFDEKENEMVLLAPLHSAKLVSTKYGSKYAINVDNIEETIYVLQSANKHIDKNLNLLYSY